jgi:hypothetical protein
MERNQVYTNFVSSEDLTGKEYYALGTDYGLCDADGETLMGIIHEVGKNVGDAGVAVVGGETYAYVVAKATDDINVGDLLTCSAAISIDGGDNEEGLLMKATIGTNQPFAIALEAITADATNNTKHLINVRLI